MVNPHLPNPAAPVPDDWHPKRQTPPEVSRQDLLLVQSHIRDRVPMAKWQTIDVTFTTPNQDVAITSTLHATDPNNVDWMPIRLSAGSIVYRDNSASQKPWRQDVIYLRATVACVARLLLFTEFT